MSGYQCSEWELLVCLTLEDEGKEPLTQSHCIKSQKTQTLSDTGVRILNTAPCMYILSVCETKFHTHVMEQVKLLFLIFGFLKSVQEDRRLRTELYVLSYSAVNLIMNIICGD